MTYQHLIVEPRGDALWVTMNRPERLNALNPGLVKELRELFVGLYWRHEVRVVVLRGAGANFCAGLDLKERGNGGPSGPSEGLVSQRRISEIVIAMRRCPQPIIALIDGAAAGGGFALALASDVRIATPTLKMNAAFIRIGLSACDIGVSYFLPRMVGSSVAAELMLTGRFIRAERALGLGLVSAVVAPEALEAEGEALAADMLRRHAAGPAPDQGMPQPLHRRRRPGSGGGHGGPQPDPVRPGRGFSRRRRRFPREARAELWARAQPLRRLKGLGRVEGRAWRRLAAAFALFGGVGLLLLFGAGLLGSSGADAARTWLSLARGPWALPAAVAAFAVLAFLGVPQFALIAGAVVVFGPWQGAAL